MIPDKELTQIKNRIDTELARSIAKHGMWDEHPYSYMAAVINGEMYEAHSALDEQDLVGEHGAYNELAQVAACCIKMMNQILVRSAQNSAVNPKINDFVPVTP